MLVDTRPTVQLIPLAKAGCANAADQSPEIGAVPAHQPVPSAGTVKSAVEPVHVSSLRALAREGRLTDIVGAGTPSLRAALSGAVFAVAWPIVYNCLTRGFEQRRGHPACARSLSTMEQDCLDRFYDDVEAVIDDVFAHATTPIRDLEAWIASRLNAATVDAHRRRRGERGALQRPRLPKWLCERVGGGAWLCDLAVQILIWVGVDATAGTELWPLDGWSVRRAAITGDPAGSTATVVAREVEQVLAAMRTKPAWYDDYVERPLGHKRSPVVRSRDGAELPPLLFTERADVDDTHLAALASTALQAIEQGLHDGRDPHEVIAEVIATAFVGDTSGHDLDFPPLHAPDHDAWVSTALADPASVDRIVSAVLAIIV